MGPMVLEGAEENIHRFLAPGLSITGSNTTPYLHCPLFLRLSRDNHTEQADTREGEGEIPPGVDTCYCYESDDALFAVLELDGRVVFGRGVGGVGVEVRGGSGEGQFPPTTSPNPAFKHKHQRRPAKSSLAQNLSYNEKNRQGGFHVQRGFDPVWGCQSAPAEVEGCHSIALNHRFIDRRA